MVTETQPLRRFRAERDQSFVNYVPSLSDQWVMVKTEVNNAILAEW